MSLTGGPGVEVDAPGCVPARFGLLSVVQPVDDASAHWQGGTYHEEQPCDGIEIYAGATCPPPADRSKSTADSGLSFPEHDPFVLVAPFQCSTPTVMGKAWDLAQQRFEQGEERGLERALWTGFDGKGGSFRTSLAGAAGQEPLPVDLTPAAGAVSITDGFALLEAWAGENMACQPILHANRGLGVYLAERSLVERDGQILRSVGTGSRVVVGGGYGVTGPNTINNADPNNPITTPGPAPAAGEGWLYISGQIALRRAPMFFTPDRGDDAAAVNREINNVTVFAERVYSLSIECGIAAIRVNLKSCCC